MKLEKSFEDYLKAVHGYEYIGTDDGMPDAFEDWLGSLDGEDYIRYADLYAQSIRDNK